MTDTQILLFGVENAADSAEVERLADLIGEPAYSAVLAVKPSPEWVLAAVRGPAARARFAVANCDDPATLGVVARTERRQVVVRALVANEHLAPDDFGVLQARFASLNIAGDLAAELHVARAVSAVSSVAAQVALALDDPERSVQEKRPDQASN